MQTVTVSIQFRPYQWKSINRLTYGWVIHINGLEFRQGYSTDRDYSIKQLQKALTKLQTAGII